MRIETKEFLEESFRNRYISFGCAANWFHKAQTSGDCAIGDFYECIYAHIRRDDPRVKNQLDSRGQPMGSNTLLLENIADGTVFLRRVPTMLKPSYCLFSFEFDELIKLWGEHNKNPILFDLDGYRKEMGYDIDSSCFLFITKPSQFIEELVHQVPLAVKGNENLTGKNFYTSFDISNPIYAQKVDYTHHNKDTFFYDLRGEQTELFWKIPDYAKQSELRITIPNINFAQPYHPQQHYDVNRNYLKVILPHLNEYAEIHSGNEIHSMLFWDFDEKKRTFKWQLSAAPRPK